MTLGTGIFLAALVISATLMYGFTRDRVNWGRGLKHLSFGAVGLAVIAAMSVAGYRWYQDRPTHQTGYCDLSLGMPDTEVLYVKGTPQELVGDSEYDKQFKGGFRLLVLPSELKSPKTIKDYTIWRYSVPNDASFYVSVGFDKQDRRVVGVACFSRHHTTCPSAAGVPIGASEELVTAKLGPGTSRFNDQVKVISYPELNVTYYLERKAVYMIVVGDPAQTL